MPRERLREEGYINWAQATGYPKTNQMPQQAKGKRGRKE
jgi:hypothetical protein